MRISVFCFCLGAACLALSSETVAAEKDKAGCDSYLRASYELEGEAKRKALDDYEKCLKILAAAKNKTECDTYLRAFYNLEGGARKKALEDHKKCLRGEPIKPKKPIKAARPAPSPMKRQECAPYLRASRKLRGEAKRKALEDHKKCLRGEVKTPALRDFTPAKRKDAPRPAAKPVKPVPKDKGDKNQPRVEFILGLEAGGGDTKAEFDFKTAPFNELNGEVEEFGTVIGVFFQSNLVSKETWVLGAEIAFLDDSTELTGTANLDWSLDLLVRLGYNMQFAYDARGIWPVKTTESHSNIVSIRPFIAGGFGILSFDDSVIRTGRVSGDRIATIMQEDGDAAALGGKVRIGVDMFLNHLYMSVSFDLARYSKGVQGDSGDISWRQTHGRVRIGYRF